MTQLTRPIDVEWALAEDLAAFLPDGWDVAAHPAPAAPGGTATTVRVTSLGGRAATPVSYSHAVSIDVWAGDGDDYGPATDAACDVAGVVGSMPLRDPPSGRHWKTAAPDSAPYANPDPDHPTVPRVTQNWTLGIRGVPIDF